MPLKISESNFENMMKTTGLMPVGTSEISVVGLFMIETLWIAANVFFILKFVENVIRRFLL